MRRSLIALVVTGLLLAACDSNGNDAAPSPTPRAETTTTADAETAGPERTGTPPERAPDPAAIETVVTGLEVPWGIAFVDADTLLVTERPGRVRLVDGDQLEQQPVAGPDVEAVGEGGVLGVALHPDFPDERWAYLYTTADGGNQVTRWQVGEDLTLSDPDVVLGGIPSSMFHNGGGVAFGPDGMLYISTGDAQEPRRSADVGSLGGKILRLTPDGAVPTDNPFPGSPVWAYGLRNPQGMAWDADGRMWATDHGPTGEFDLCCNDEVNRIERGGFYGWPFLAAGQIAAPGDPPQDPIAPAAASGPDDRWAPVGIGVLGAGDDATVVVAGLRGEVLLRFPLRSDGTLGDPSTARDDLGRLRAVAVGPDGCLWVSTSNRDGRGNPAGGDDRLLRAC